MLDDEDKRVLKWILGIGGPIFSTSATEIGDGDPLVGTVSLAMFGGAIWTSETSEDSPDFTIRGWFRNNVPYTYVEKRAYRNFNNLHPDSKISNKQSYFTADTKETYEVVLELLGNKSREQIMEDLEVLEMVMSYKEEHKDKAEKMCK